MSLSSVTEWLGGRLRSAWFVTLWVAKALWRRARGQHGTFRRGEVSARAAELTGLWERRWAGSDPVGHLLCHEYADRWVRFHSLPQSKQYADNDAEYAEILRRHRSVLRELHGSHDLRPLHVIGGDWGWHDLAAGWSKRHLPHAWPWRSSVPDDHPDADPPTYFWATSGLTPDELDALLIAVADEECGSVVIGARDLSWLYCPYDGGADIILPGTVERDILRERHADWLPAHPNWL